MKNEEELYLSTSPTNEECAQIGTSDYYKRASIECSEYIKQLKRIFGQPPLESKFKIKHCPHDFGTYYEVVISFNESNDEESEYAYNVESNVPEYWDEIAKENIKQKIQCTNISMK
jgi:hypothetical protein